MCAFGGMCQCPEGHLFCTDCLRAHAGTQLGSLNAKICCMSPEGSGPGGCGLPFPPSQLRLHLPAKLYALYVRCGQQQQLREAREAGILDDLEECPFCDWACEIPKERGWEVDRLFR
ncbi:hypothetical protein FA15DRAFT_223553 [Coprinopsis marcescibilis]|uniref:RING-type domain-containing protein n=1 Tax=Coprinopsis marcescibilis TaxID=230819 RepID=A0A5C3KG10_COPMA|nr:hypothetical protein FA15DRAFT_223553 [Coprinopsis marcescibilis]